ncbi:hypothetical protein M8J77_025871 [Diaphorina citri]|nr:hypothetical protein M8J77_025871 [Diaphorina citri]
MASKTPNEDKEFNEQRPLAEVPSEFPFPFDAYDIQSNFMKNLYYTLDNSKFGIFESPTGTGKSLSLICGILKWYYDHKIVGLEKIEAKIKDLEISKNETVSEDWIEQQSFELKMRNQIDALKDALKSQKTYDELIENIRKQNEKRKKSLRNDQEVKVHALTYRNRMDEKNSKEKRKEEERDGLENETQELDEYTKEISEDKDMLLDDIDALDNENDEEDTTEGYSDLKIYFCSRTHSQLAQFVKEINKTVYRDQLRVTSLSSRQNYCINESVNRLKNINLINEKCIELSKQSKKTKVDEDARTLKKQKSTHARCPYKTEVSVELLKNEILSNIHDIEEVVNESKTIKACPYYASRAAVKHAQMIVLPYNILLHKSTREMCKINLKDSVVVIDEAHNLLDMIESIHSCQVSADSVYHCYNQIQNYKTKFLSKFNAHNLLHINQMVYLLKMFLSALNFKHLIEKKRRSIKDMKRNVQTPSETQRVVPSVPSVQQREESKLLTLSDFLMENNIDNINVFKLLEFIKQSKLCYKLQNYSMKYKDCLKPPVEVVEKTQEKPKLSGLQSFLKGVQENKPNLSKPSEGGIEEAPSQVQEDQVRNPMLSVVTFLESLVNKNEDGRILVTKNPELSKSHIKYILLNPANHFTDIVQDARSIIVAGGTMEPVSEFKDQLFGSLGVPESRIHHFSCGHVIPKENILPLILCSGPTNRKFDLTFENRTKGDTLKEIAMTITNLCTIVPKGMVCFFPSYDYEAIVYNYMRDNHFIERIAKKKVVFREPKKTSEVDKVLSDYGKSVEKGGALMLSVIGGKLSEGLNFSDDLGRCVVVVGMPYANIKSLYIQEKMKYLDSHVSPGAGQLYYRNSCMKGVNQSIGRAIRHANDYACMVLVDVRYESPAVRQMLPGWIRDHLRVAENFGSLFKSVNAFFQSKRQS